jgi:GTP-binding protein
MLTASRMAIITLTTDFGTRDGYVGAVKGVLARHAPDATVIDLGHDLPRGDIAHAAWVVASSTVEFPSGTIHLVVVDPGVGGARREVIVATGGHRYVGPDNGVFAYVAELEYGAWAGMLATRSRGTLVSMENGTIIAFALAALQERSTLFVSPGEPVYEGMIVGENSRPGDMDVNPTKEKKLTNMRTTGTDENIRLEPPRELTLEGALEYIEDDELIEVTPQSIRLRKRLLAQSDRKKISREAKRERAAL